MSAQDLALSRLATTAGIAGLAIGALGGAAFAAGVASGVIGAPPAPDRFSGSSVKFPEELDQNDHWIEFTAKQTKGLAEGALSSSLGLSIGSTTLGGTMRLPMPSNLSTDYNPEYSTPNLGSAAGMALKPSDQAIYSNNTMGAQALAGNGLQGIINAAVGAAAGATVDAAKALAAPLGGGNAADALLKVAGGVAVNPHKIVLFTGVNFRDHTFSWKLSPKTRRDSDTIRQIINMFTYYAHPEYVAGGLFLKYPEFFTIKFHHPEYLFTLQPSVLTDIRVNYHGQGYPAYIRDANGFGTPAPAEVDLSLTFKETEIVTKQSLNPSIDITNNTPRQRPPSPAAPLYTDSNGPIVIGPNGTPLYGP
jgi:hypothetical protein